MAGDTGTKYIRATVAGIGRQQVFLPFRQKRIDRLAVTGGPSPVRVVTPTNVLVWNR